MAIKSRFIIVFVLVIVVCLVVWSQTRLTDRISRGVLLAELSPQHEQTLASKKISNQLNSKQSTDSLDSQDAARNEEYQDTIRVKSHQDTVQDLVQEARIKARSPTLTTAAHFTLPSPEYTSVPLLAVYPQPTKGLSAQDLKKTGLGLGTPIVASMNYTSPMLFLDKYGLPHTTFRDLGYTGVLDGKVIWTFGDTLIGSDKSNTKLSAVDSATIGNLKYPMLSQDTHMTGKVIESLTPLLPSELADGGYSTYSFGGTNIVEVAPGEGLIYYLKVKRPPGSLNGQGYQFYGAGAAKVILQDDVAVATRFGEHLWSADEPTWGDVGIALDGRDGHVYVFGHGPAGDASLSKYTFLARVPATGAGEVQQYEYWDNAQRTWGKQRASSSGGDGTARLRRETAIFGALQMNQAAPFWSNYINRWVFLHSSGFSVGNVYLLTAEALEGPWQDHGQIAETKPSSGESGAYTYAVNGHPEFDDSGKTVLVTWTNANVIYGCTIEWALKF